MRATYPTLFKLLWSGSGSWTEDYKIQTLNGLFTLRRFQILPTQYLAVSRLFPEAHFQSARFSTEFCIPSVFISLSLQVSNKRALILFYRWEENSFLIFFSSIWHVGANPWNISLSTFVHYRCAQTHTHIHTHTQTHTHTHTLTYSQTYTHMFTSHVLSHTFTLTHTYILTHIRAYTYKSTHNVINMVYHNTSVYTVLFRTVPRQASCRAEVLGSPHPHPIFFYHEIFKSSLGSLWDQGQTPDPWLVPFRISLWVKKKKPKYKTRDERSWWFLAHENSGQSERLAREAREGSRWRIMWPRREKRAWESRCFDSWWFSRSQFSLLRTACASCTEPLGDITVSL